MTASRHVELPARILSLIALAVAVGCGGGETESPTTPSEAASPPKASSSAPVASTPETAPSGTAPPTMRGSLQVQTAAGAVEIVPEAFDFGAVDPGSINRGVFRMTNRGQGPVRVLRVTPSCVCTTLSDLAGTVIGAGQTVSLEASLDAPDQPGEKEAKVFVYLEGMQQPAIVKLSGMITLPIQPTPAYADALGGVVNGVIALAATDGRPFRVLASNGGPPEFVGGGADGASRAAYSVRWSIVGMAPASIPKWWIFTTDRVDCPLVACRVRHQATGSRRDPTRFDRRWVPEEDLFVLDRLAIGLPVEIECRIKHYNPRGGGVVDKPDWSRVLAVGCLDDRLEVSLVSATGDGNDAVDLVVSVVPRGPATDLLYVPIQIETATGRGEIEIAAEVVPAGGRG